MYRPHTELAAGVTPTLRVPGFERLVRTWDRAQWAINVATRRPPRSELLIGHEWHEWMGRQVTALRHVGLRHERYAGPDYKRFESSQQRGVFGVV